MTFDRFLGFCFILPGDVRDPEKLHAAWGLAAHSYKHKSDTMPLSVALKWSEVPRVRTMLKE